MLIGRLMPPLAVIAMLLVGTPQSHAQGTNLDNASCLGCHGDTGLSVAAGNGGTRSLSLSSDHFARSVHGTLQCTSCHTTITEIPHQVQPLTPTQRRQQIATMCQACHADSVERYRNSVHGRQSAGGGNVNAALCTDCHSAHAIADPQSAPARLAITSACGGCHASAMASYSETYHGQIYVLGYANTATCSDCHAGHAVLPASDPASTVSSANILTTCRACHRDASAGFATFQAHATTDDFQNYPYTWIAAKACWAMIFGVFGVCWFHSALWLYREIRDRQQRRLRPHVRGEILEGIEVRQFGRWSLAWRFAHLVFAVSVILLVLTGIPPLYANTAWAPLLERMLGGPAVVSIIHRVAAVVMTGGFIIHFAYVAGYIARHWRRISWFGPYSLLPTLQDGRDVAAMFKWFVGAGPRPTFDHWNYQQKLDYWGSFSGVALLTATGAMLWFKTFTAIYLPGWALNVADVVHGHEALFAAGYLFIVHYFVNHWRPDKFPLDLVMFTGSIPLDEFKREYGVEYARLTQAGELEHYLVEAPSRPMKVGATILGLGLVAISLALLILMVNGIGANL